MADYHISLCQMDLHWNDGKNFPCASQADRHILFATGSTKTVCIACLGRLADRPAVTPSGMVVPMVDDHPIDATCVADDPLWSGRVCTERTSA